MKKPRIRRKNRNRQNCAPTKRRPTDIAGGGRSFQIASRHGRSRRRGGHGVEEQVPDAAGAGLRRREQDALDDRVAGAGVTLDSRRRKLFRISDNAVQVRCPPLCCLASQSARAAVFSFARLTSWRAASWRRAHVRFGRFARQPQGFQPRHIVEHGLRGASRRIAGPGVWPPARPCRNAHGRGRDLLLSFGVFFSPFGFGLGLGFGSGGFSRSAASRANRTARRFAVRFRWRYRLPRYRPSP